MIDAIGASTSAAHYAPTARSLNYADATLVWLLNWSGDANHVIAAKLGTMPSRVADVLAENAFVGSREQATKMKVPKRAPDGN